jgi:protein-tyrosine sulfotransferase
MLGRIVASVIDPVEPEMRFVYPYSGPLPHEPVFIVGSGRSGTTLLRRMLMEGGEIHFPPESYVLGPVIRRFAIRRYLPWRTIARRVLRDFQRHPEFVRFGIDPAVVLPSMILVPDRDRSLSVLLDVLYRFHSTTNGSGARRWGDKSPINTRYLDEIIRVFPSGRFVNMIRDGCDVVASYLAMGRYGSLEEAALRWRSSIEAVESFGRGHPHSVHPVRYEELVREPEQVLQRLCTELGLTFHPAMIEAASPAFAGGDVEALSHHQHALRSVETSRIGAGRARLARADRSALQGLIGPTLATLGYPPATESP